MQFVDRRLPSDPVSRVLATLAGVVVSLGLLGNALGLLLSGMLQEGSLELFLWSVTFVNSAPPFDVLVGWGLLAVAAVGLAVSFRVGRGVEESGRPRSEGEENVEYDPVSELRERYLRGDIDEEAYERELERLLDGDEPSKAVDRDRSERLRE